jgi:hypothetical protein
VQASLVFDQGVDAPAAIEPELNAMISQHAIDLGHIFGFHCTLGSVTRSSQNWDGDVWQARGPSPDDSVIHSPGMKVR